MADIGKEDSEGVNRLCGEKYAVKGSIKLTVIRNRNGEWTEYTYKCNRVIKQKKQKTNLQTSINIEL